MKTWRHGIALLALSGATVQAAGSAGAGTAEDRCDELYSQYRHYVAEYSHHNDGERVQAEFAKYSCDVGRTEDGIRTLEVILRRNLVNYPKEGSR